MTACIQAEGALSTPRLHLQALMWSVPEFCAVRCFCFECRNQFLGESARGSELWCDCLCIFALSAGFIFRSKLMWMRTLPSNVKLAIRLLQAMLQMMKSLGGGIYLFFSFPKSHCSNISVSLCVFLIHISWRCLFYVRDSDCVMSSQLVQPFFVIAWSPVLSYLFCLKQHPNFPKNC